MLLKQQLSACTSLGASPSSSSRSRPVASPSSHRSSGTRALLKPSAALHQDHARSRAATLASVPIAVALLFSAQAASPPPSMAEMTLAAPESTSGSYAYTDEEDVRRQEARYDENLMTPELKELVEVLEKKGSNVKADELQVLRKRVGFSRSPEGRVSLRSRDGDWYNVKADMQTPGFLLLRNESNGSIWFLPPDESGRLVQIDLSDDIVVAELFSSGAWYDVKEPLYDAKFGSPKSMKPLVMSKAEFSDVVSLLEGAIEQ